MSNKTFGASAAGGFATQPTKEDPYKYQVGFGNRFASEAMWVIIGLCLSYNIFEQINSPGTLPHAQNMPQKNKYDLYVEQMTGNPFTAVRAENMHAYVNCRPIVGAPPFLLGNSMSFVDSVDFCTESDLRWPIKASRDSQTILTYVTSRLGATLDWVLTHFSSSSPTSSR